MNIKKRLCNGLGLKLRFSKTAQIILSNTLFVYLEYYKLKYS